MSESVSSSSGLSRDELRGRLLWMVQPFLLLVTVLFWVLNPSVVDTKEITTPMLVAYIMGLVIAAAGKRTEIAQYLDLSSANTADVYRKNRVPEEYYWGYKEQVLFARKKK